MKVREEIKTIEQKVVTYVADDGTEFEKECECKKYEIKQKLNKAIEAAEALRIKDLDDLLPISNDGSPEENNTFRWYRLENKEDFEIVEKAYGNSYGVVEPTSFPEIICVETIGYEAYMDEAYSYDLTTCRNITKSFWNKLGYKVGFSKL